MRDYELIDLATGRPIGTARVVDDIGPGQLVLRFRAGEFRVEEIKAAPPAAGPRPPQKRKRA